MYKLENKHVIEVLNLAPKNLCLCHISAKQCQTDRDHFQSNWSLQMEIDEIYLQKKLFQKHKTFPIKKRGLIFLR